MLDTTSSCAQVACHERKWYVGIMKNSSRAKSPARFHVVVEAADRLTVEEQETLVAVLNRRLADRRRAKLAADIREAQREFERGALRPTTPDEIIKEILS
jgi:hypothetical protein